VATSAKAPPSKRTGRLARFLLAIGVAAVLVLGSAILAAWARSGYYVAFDDNDQVIVYQGREGGVLWFDPTRESLGPMRDDLDADAIELVEQNKQFESLASAQLFVSERLTPVAVQDDTEADG
jgi:hypothetical protein